MSQPSLTTERLLLRPFVVADAPAVQQLAGERAIADTTLNVPHPYEDGMAEAWIVTHENGYAEGNQATFAVVKSADSQLLGAIGLVIDSAANKANLGYWTGKPYWNKGYATEAAICLIGFGFEELKLNRIDATHLARNPASGRVMQKAGMTLEGTARQATRKWGNYEDLVWYGLLSEDWNS